MIRSNLTLIFWGILVVVVDVKLGWFDVLVDPAGYFLIFHALRPLGAIEEKFGKARQFALGALLASIPAMFGSSPTQLTFFLETAFAICLNWLICTGILTLATAQGNVILSASALRTRTLNVAASVVNTLVVAIALARPEVARVFVLPTVGFSLVVMTVTLLLLRSASRELVAAPEHPSMNGLEAPAAQA